MTLGPICGINFLRGMGPLGPLCGAGPLRVAGARSDQAWAARTWRRSHSPWRQCHELIHRRPRPLVRWDQLIGSGRCYADSTSPSLCHLSHTLAFGGWNTKYA